MDIAIIGSGNIGGALARGLGRAGHTIHLAARDKDRVRGLAAEVGAIPHDSPAGAARRAAVVVLAVPWAAVEELARELAPVVGGKIVVDVTNPARLDNSGPLFAGDGSAAERLAAWLPEAHVVKAFNTIFGSNLAAGGSREGIRLDALVAADDADARAAVIGLAADLGFDAVDAGRLSNAALLEAIAWLNISLNMANGWTWQSGWKLVGASSARTPGSIAA
jgi:8-hydroxy-5-deazaflavin:NADPH oxidoreductase